ncbi:MAG: hypothetical protein WAL26_05280 [Mycobacterium sp.]
MNTPQGPQPYRHNQPPPQHRYPPPPQQHRPPPPQQYRPPPPPPQQHHQPPQYGQPPAPQQPWQQPQPYGQPGEGIVVNTQFFPLAWVLFFIKPKIAVDGQEMPASAWGRTHLPARPGQHHVHVHVPYFLPPKMGPADATVDVRPGQVAELEYKAPMWAFSAGSLGVGPQKYNGVGITIAVVAIPFILVFLMILLFVVLAAI